MIFSTYDFLIIAANSFFALKSLTFTLLMGSFISKAISL